MVIDRGVLLLLFCISLPVFAESKISCSQEEAIAAEEQTNSLKSWKEVFVAFSKFDHCDDGAIAESFDDSIDKLLVDKNPDYDGLSGYTKRNQKFRLFVLKHLAATGTGDDINTAGKKALDCYVNTKRPICKDIALSVADGFDEAIKEISKDQKNGIATQEQMKWKAYLQEFVVDIRKSISSH